MENSVFSFMISIPFPLFFCLRRKESLRPRSSNMARAPFSLLLSPPSPAISPLCNNACITTSWKCRKEIQKEWEWQTKYEGNERSTTRQRVMMEDDGTEEETHTKHWDCHNWDCLLILCIKWRHWIWGGGDKSDWWIVRASAFFPSKIPHKCFLMSNFWISMDVWVFSRTKSKEKKRERINTHTQRERKKKKKKSETERKRDIEKKVGRQRSSNGNIKRE